jgi:hypothetical protein
MTLTKSRFRIALECPRKLVYGADPRYANARGDDELLEALAEGGHQVGALAQRMHPDGIEVGAASVADQVAETQQRLRAENITLFEPSFQHGNLVARVDVLIKRGTTIRLIEVKAKGFDPAQDSFQGNGGVVRRDWLPYLCDVAFQALVLERAHPAWSVTPCLMLLDTSAPAALDGVGAQFPVARDGRAVRVHVRPGFDAAALDPPLLRIHDVSAEVQALRRETLAIPGLALEFEPLVDALAAVLAAGEAFAACVGPQCRRCEFYCDPAEVADDHRSGWAECLQTTTGRAVPWPRSATVFGLYACRQVGALLQSGALALAGLDESRFAAGDQPGEISLSHRHRLQVREAKGIDDGVHLERDALRRAFDSWRFPLHFVDFETARPALPFHRSCRPHELLLFQFSHHVLERDGRLRHADECLVVAPGVWPNAAVVRALQAALGADDGTVVHWWDHEKTVLKEVRGQLLASSEGDREGLAEFIDGLVGAADQDGRLADLGRLVARAAFFPSTAGRSSIKCVLPAVLARSQRLRQRYGQPVYGTPEMRSSNFPSGWVWVREAEGGVRDPYALLDPLLPDAAEWRAVEAAEQEETGLKGFVANGGAAMVAYGELQSPDLGDVARRGREAQLRRYCELDTLAMVMVYEALADWIGPG